MPRKRNLTEEEKLLWEQVTKGDKPLPSSSPPPLSGDTFFPFPPPLRGRAREGGVFDTSQNPCLKRGIITDNRQLTVSNYAGIDRKTAENFRKGKNVDAVLDLHGFSLEAAHTRLFSFIEQQIREEKRRLLVITGKGSGILRSSLPAWLNAPALNRHILAFDTASLKHGGTGAYYILLKRNRNRNGA